MTSHQPPPLPNAATCPWCGAAVSAGDLSCPRCGAPVALRPRPSTSGWTELPAIRDLTRLRIGQSTCQIEGVLVPVADFNLAAGDSMIFAHHTLLWKDSAVEIRRQGISGAVGRLLGGMPMFVTTAHGPGHVAFSRDEPGELIALPIHPQQHIHVCEHLFLAGAGDLRFDYFDCNIWFSTRQGNETETLYPLGRWMDDFHAGENPALLLLHAAGNAFVRQLAPGQSLLIKPRSLIYKDRTVHMSPEIEYPRGTTYSQQRLIWLRLTGPGRVAVQSAYEPVEDNGRQIMSTSQGIY
jgi:uncharacterized protein (AIM24 family)